MLDFVKWLIFGLLLGWISLPLTWRLFKKLPSRGSYLAKPVGLLSWGFLFWLLVSIGIFRNNLSSQVTALLIIATLNGLVLYKIGWEPFNTWLKENRKFLIVTELIFFVFFSLWAIIRAANPDIIHTEKFMEMAFINGILRSETFPPMDPWLSGYGISYYYFGYVLSAMLIRITNVASSVGYNLISAFWFGLSAIAVYGILSDLIILKKESKCDTEKLKNLSKKIQWIALIAPIMLLFVSNWFGVLDVAHSRGIAWNNANGELVQSDFWTGLNISELNNPPREISWVPNRGGWSWWQASRVLKDTSLSGNSIEVIDEFPQFTFLLSDIHPHMLSMPFVLLAIAQVLNAIKGGWAASPGNITVFKHFDPWVVLFAILSLGGIAFMNTWDFPFYLALMAAALVFRRYQQLGWDVKRIYEFLAIVIVGGLLSIILYLPFYLSFASQAGGILPSLAFFTPGKSFWIMFGPFLIPIAAFLLVEFVRKKAYKQIAIPLLIILALFFLLFLMSWGIGFILARSETSYGFLLGLQGATNVKQLLTESILLRLKAPGTAVTLFYIIVMSLSLLLNKKSDQVGGVPENHNQQPSSHFVFVLFLIILGALLTLAPEFIYLRDNFSWRMNTIFKFYFQAWIVWSLSASYAIAIMINRVKKGKLVNILFTGLISLLGVVSFTISLKDRQPLLGIIDSTKFGALKADWLVLIVAISFLIWIVWHLARRQYSAALTVIGVMAIFGGLIYPVLEIWNKTEGFQPHLGFTLDGKRVFRESYPDAMLAAEWLETAPVGVMAEAVADQGGSYTSYNLISTFSGMPSVLGWVGHEHQWRGGGAEVGTRQQDLKELYSTRKADRVKAIVAQYHIRYIIFGNYERDTYRTTDELFAQLFEPVFRSESLTIYEVKP